MTHYAHPQCASCRFLMTKIEIGHDDTKAPWYHKYLQAIGFLKDGPLGPPTIDQYLYCRNSQNANFVPTFATNWCGGYDPRTSIGQTYYLQAVHQFFAPAQAYEQLERIRPDPRYIDEWNNALAKFKRQIDEEQVNSAPAR